jgi:hypothetical protein
MTMKRDPNNRKTHDNEERSGKKERTPQLICSLISIDPESDYMQE